MAKPLGELRRMSDEELIAEHDKVAPSTVGGVAYYLNELARRDAQRQGNRMERLTWFIAGLTVVNAVLVAVSLFWR